MDDEQTLETIAREFCAENGLHLALSWEMPAGYETAYGTYDIAENTLFLNWALLEKLPRGQQFFYLCHELRHGMQYQQPEQFSPFLRESLPYVLLYDGTCFRLQDGVWRQGKLEGEEAYFTNAYLGFPYEMDANQFAYEQVCLRCGASEALERLLTRSSPEKIMTEEEYQQLFRRIDEKLAT